MGALTITDVTGTRAAPSRGATAAQPARRLSPAPAAGPGRRGGLPAARSAAVATLVSVDFLDGRPGPSDDDRTVELDSDELPVLPEQTRDDTDQGWGDPEASNDARLFEDRPPHWA